MISGVRSKARASVLWLAVLLLLMVLSGCGRGEERTLLPGQAKKPGSPYPMTLTDSYDRKVTLQKEPARIISLVPSHTEILFSIGVDSKIVGVTNFCDYPAEAKAKEKVGGFSNPSVEKIVALKPDLVFAGDLHKNIVEQIEKLGIPVLALSARSVKAVPDLIALIGRAAGAEQKAAQVAEDISSRIDAVTLKTNAIEDKQKPAVYYELWHDPPTSVGPGSFLHDLIELAGGKSIAADTKSAYPKMSAEVIIQRNPDIILYAHSKQRAEQIAQRPGFKDVSAVKSGRVILFDDENIFMRAGPRIADALEQMARVMHPSIFK